MRRAVYLLMLAMVFTLPWENVLSLPGLGRISKLIGLLAAATWVATVLITGRFREPKVTHFLALLFVVWNGFSLLWTVDGSATQGRVITYAQLLGLMLVLWDTVDTMPRVHATLTSYLAGSYVTVVALLVGYVLLGVGSERHGRVTLGSFHPNDVGMILAVSVPVAAYLMWVPPREERHWRRLWALGCAAYVPLAAFAVLVTGSRAALASMIPGLAYLFYLLTRRHKAVSIGTLVGLAAVGVLAIPFVPARVLLRLEGTDAALRAGNLNERETIWSEALRLIREHPIQGSGGGAFRAAAVGANKAPHDLALGLLAEVGVIGFGLFAAMLVTALLSLRHVEPMLRGMWVAVFTAWLGAALLHNWEARKQTWMLIGLVVACGALDSARGREPDQDAAAPSDGPSPDNPADRSQHRERGSAAVPDLMRPVSRR
jgi:O-antigen ligase